MSKLQLLYEKLMRIAYVFGGIFFLLSLIDFTAAMMTGAFSCSSGTCGIGEQYAFFQFTLWPLIILTAVFIITGYVFFKLAHKESDLLSVSDYKKSIEETSDSDDVISREELYEKLKRGNRKPKVQTESIFQKISKSISGFFKSISDKIKRAKEKKIRQTTEQKAAEAEVQAIEEIRLEKEKLERVRTKLNKTALILLISKNTDLTQNNSRLFVNSLLEIIKDKVISGEEVKISKFGRFEKVHIKEHTETNQETGVETKVEAHNEVEFFAYKTLLEKLNEGMEIVDVEEVSEEVQPEPVIEEVQEEVQPEPVIEEIQEEVQPEPVIEEVQEEVQPEPVIEEVQEEVQPEPVVEEVQEEVQPEPVVEEVQEEVQPEPVVEEVQEEVQPEPVVEEVQEEVQPEPAVEQIQEEVQPKPVIQDVKEVAKKPAKPKVSVKTKKQIIEMMDETTDLSKNKANKFLKFFAEVVKEQLIKREDVELEGIGFFTTIEMPAKEAVNPQTNEKIIVPAHHQVRLRFDDELKDKMN